MQPYGPPLEEPPDPTPDQAREQLALAGGPPVVRRADLVVHASTSVVLGVLFGFWPLAMTALDPPAPWHTVAWVALMVTAAGLGSWQQHTRTVPRHAQRRYWAAAGVTIVLMLVGTVVVGPGDSSGPVTAVQVGVAAVVASPIVACGLLILRGRRP